MLMFEIMPMTVSNEAIPYVVMSSPLLLVAMVKWNNYIQSSYYHNFLQSQDLGICKVSTPSLAFLHLFLLLLFCLFFIGTLIVFTILIITFSPLSVCLSSFFYCFR